MEPSPLPSPWAVPLIVAGRRDQPQPVTIGIPFPRGALAADDSLLLTGPGGHALDVQTQPLARWPDGSVQWLLLDFVLPPGGGDLSLRRGEPPAPHFRLSIKESSQELTIDTGAVVFRLDPA